MLNVPCIYSYIYLLNDICRYRKVGRVAEFKAVVIQNIGKNLKTYYNREKI